MAKLKTSKRRRDEDNVSEKSSSKRVKPSPSNEAIEPAPDFDFPDTFQVRVGKNSRSGEFTFTVDTKLALPKSPFFAAALSNRWLEGQERIVRLPEHSSEAFRIFDNWLYTDWLELMPRGPNPNAVPRRTPNYLSHIQVFNLAHYLGSSELCNLVIDSLIANVSYGDIPVPAGALWKRALEGTKLWDVMIDHFVWRYVGPVERPDVDYTWDSVHIGELDDEVDHIGDLDDELGRIGEVGRQAIAKKLVMGECWEDSNIVKRPRCYYHEHAEGEKCPSDSESGA